MLAVWPPKKMNRQKRRTETASIAKCPGSVRPTSPLGGFASVAAVTATGRRRSASSFFRICSSEATASFHFVRVRTAIVVRFTGGGLVILLVVVPLLFQSLLLPDDHVSDAMHRIHHATLLLDHGLAFGQGRQRASDGARSLRLVRPQTEIS